MPASYLGSRVLKTSPMKIDEEQRLELEIAQDEERLEKLYEVVIDVRDHYNKAELDMMQKRRSLDRIRKSRRSK